MMEYYKERIGSVCLTLAVIILIAFMPISSHAELLMGDVNCDGKVNTGDAVIILRYCINDAEISFYGLIAADVKADETINTGDATALLYNIANENDYIQPVEKIGDIACPVLYTDINYETLSAKSSVNINLSCYTSDAVQSPKNTVVFGQGYSVKLTEGKSYVFETSLGSNSDYRPDTMLYLIDNANNVFMYDDNGGDGKFSRIEFYAWESSTYKLLVTGKDSSDVGSLTLNIGEHIYVKPTPTATATATPKPTPTASPTPTPTATTSPTPTPTTSPAPTPTETPIYTGDIGFINQSVPQSGQVVQYGSPYGVNGIITTDKVITKVRLEIVNKSGATEMSASKTFSSTLKMHRYALNDGGDSSIDGQLKFSELDIGKKTLKLYCKTNGEDEVKIFESSFYVGATDELLKANAFSGSATLSQAVRADILNYINSLDETAIGTKVIMEAFTNLGVTYGTGTGQLDCSLLVKNAYATVGINLPRTAAEQAKYCYEKTGALTPSKYKPGDLVFLEQVGCNCGRWHEIHHVAIYIGTVNDTKYFIEASSGKKKIVLRKAWGDGDTSGWSTDFYSRPY